MSVVAEEGFLVSFFAAMVISVSYFHVVWNNYFPSLLWLQPMRYGTSCLFSFGEGLISLHLKVLLNSCEKISLTL